jgi:AcrR family transcriptional regulator
LTLEHETACSGTREALLEAGLICFAERGFEGASLRKVADRAGRTTSLIAHHFGNKEGLYLAVFNFMLARQAGRAWSEPLVDAAELERDPDWAAALLRRLIVHQFLRMHGMCASADPLQCASFHLWLTALNAPVPGLEEVMKDWLRPLRLQVAACVQALRPGLPAEEIPFWCSLVHGQCVMNTMMQGFNRLVFGPEAYPDSPELTAGLIADVTLRAIGRA